MVRELHKKTSKGLEGLENLEKEFDKDVKEVEKLREKDFKNELDVGFFFSVVFDTYDEREAWLKAHGIKLQEDFFVKAKDFNI